ncbi:MAG: hypothetical protein IJ901_00160 [Bacteroidaceae bacterium]|nr:hypothetical protein [Bacteroidaceae bacterium]
MKKLLTLYLMLLAVALTLKAQQPAEFRFHGKPLANGATVTLDMEEDPFEIDPPYFSSNPSEDPENGLVLVNLTNQQLSGASMLTIQQNTLTTSPFQWCMGGSCERFYDPQYSKDFTLPAGGQTQVQFDVYPTADGTLEATLEVMIQLRRISVTIRCTNVPDQAWWGNYTDGSTLKSTGSGEKDTYDCAVLYRQSRTEMDGSTIHGVRFYLNDKTNLSDVKVWISSTRPTSPDKADITCINVENTLLKDYVHDGEMIEVMLPSAYTVESDVYVGYSFKVNAATTDYDKHPVLYASTKMADGFWLKLGKNPWSNYTLWYGNLSTQLLISNPNLGTHAVSVETLTKAIGVKSQQSTVMATGLVDGLAGVSSLDYVVSIDGTPQAERHYTLPNPITAYGSSFTFPVEFTAPATSGTYSYDLQITQVNGQPNDAEITKATAAMLTLDRSALRRSVMEEFTGTWCGWCPRGIVGMANLEREFGDRFIGIAMHADDPMSQKFYNNLLTDRFPSSRIDRTIECEPYLGTLRGTHYASDQDFRRALETPTEAELQLTATWVDDDCTQISLSATTTFLYTNDHAAYSLAYFITADSITGTAGKWAQANYLPGSQFRDADLDFFRSASDPVVDMVYNHVAIAGSSVGMGDDTAIGSSIVSGQGITAAKTITLDNTALSLLNGNKKNLHGIVLLLDTETGKVVNAVKADVKQRITIEDITQLIMLYLEGASATPDTDIDGDGQFTVGDITSLINNYLIQN